MMVGNHELGFLRMTTIDRKGLLVDVPLRSLTQPKHKQWDMIFLQLQQLCLPFLCERSKIQTWEATDVGYIIFVQFDPLLTTSNVGNPNR